jgi:hypothetical protein
MLSIESVHKRVKVFKIELGLLIVACLVMVFFVWQILSAIKVLQ